MHFIIGKSAVPSAIAGVEEVCELLFTVDKTNLNEKIVVSGKLIF